MKKTTIALIILTLIAGLFISCSQEMTVDADVHNKIIDIDTFCINGKYFSTLQAAVDYFKDSKAMKAVGDNDNVIYLTKNASGPGADIADVKDLTIDFAGFTYSFTDVTAKQGETGGKFGLSITDGSEVTLKGLEQIDLFDSTADLTMVYIEGSGTSLTIEDAPKMVVEPTQYVFWAANGATLTIGSTEDETKEAAITGKIAATGGETEESAPSITVQAKTTITGSVEATKASVTLSGKTVVTGTVSATESKIEANEASKITGAIEASASKVSVSGAAKIEVDLTAKDNSEVVIDTVATGAEASVIKTMDKEETSTVVVAGGTVNVEEVAEGSDKTIEVADDATVSGDDVQKEEIKSYVAKIIGKTVYGTMEEAIEAASTTGHRDEIILLQSITKNIEIPNDRDVIINLKSYGLGEEGSNISVTVKGSVTVRAEAGGAVYGEMHLKSGSDTLLEGGTYFISNYGSAVEEGAELTITGGKYNFNPGYKATGYGFVPAYCKIQDPSPTWPVVRRAKDDEDTVAEISGRYYENLQFAINDAEDGETVKLLKGITQDAGFIVDKANMDVSLDLNGKTITVNNGANINNRAFRIDNGTLRVSGGTIVAVGSGTTGCYGAFRVESSGILYAENMTLSNARNNGLNVKVLGGEAYLTGVTITSSYGGGIEVTEADLGTHSKPGIATLTDCTFNQADYFDHCSTALSVSGGSELIVNSGTYSGEYGLYVFSSGGYITVKDGTFTGTPRNVLKAEIDTKTYPQYIGGFVIEGGSFTGTASITSPATMNITGGEYSFDPSAYVAEGYYADNTEIEGKWVVKPASSLFDGGTGIEDDPFIIKDYDTFQNVSKLYNAGYYYYKVKDGVESIDCSNWTTVNLNGNINGNNVTINSLDNVLLTANRYANNVVISNFVINAHIVGDDTDGAVLSVSARETYLNNVIVHGYIQGSDRASAFVGWGIAGIDMSWYFDNCYSDATLVGHEIGGFIAHPWCNNTDARYVFLNDSLFEGVMIATGNHCYINGNSATGNPSKEGIYMNFNDSDLYSRFVSVCVARLEPNTHSVDYQYENAPNTPHKFNQWSGTLDTTTGISGAYNYIKRTELVPINHKASDYSKGNTVSVEKNEKTKKAIAFLSIGPNDSEGYGNYVGTYVGPENLDVSSETITTTSEFICDVFINKEGTTSTGYNSDNTEFYVVDSRYGTTYGSATITIAQYDADGYLIQTDIWDLRK